ncbi:hypothetical protein [Acinetobacter sp. SEK570]|uniref:hypothetical protein n=1 Tax=unclassified Acinetobacter TaxID=196816 RepID=UPI0039A12B6F
MDNESVIEELLSFKEDYFFTEIIQSSFDDSIYIYIPTDRISESAKEGFVSKKQLDNFLKKSHRKFSKKIEIIYQQSEKLELLADGIKLMLRSQFNDFLEDINITFLSAEKVNIWFKFKKIDSGERIAIETYTKALFAESNIFASDIQWEGELLEFPSMMEILITTKKIQPISITKFSEILKSEFPCVEEKWLNRQLDKLIKKDLVVRDPISEKYTLTWKGLNLIPNVFNNSNSDIKRALSLGRIKW